MTVNGHAHRVWSKGTGRPLGFLAGIGGLPKWTPFLDRLAESRQVIAPSLPGFPGAAGHEDLDTIFDWILATHDIVVREIAGAGHLAELDQPNAVAAAVREFLE